MKQKTSPFRNKIEEAQELLSINRDTIFGFSKSGKNTLKKARKELTKMIKEIDKILET